MSRCPDLVRRFIYDHHAPVPVLAGIPVAGSVARSYAKRTGKLKRSG